jgi:hypothetical protein
MSKQPEDRFTGFPNPPEYEELIRLRVLNRELVGALKLLRAVFIVGGTYEMQNNALAAADAALAKAKGK